MGGEEYMTCSEKTDRFQFSSKFNYSLHCIEYPRSYKFSIYFSNSATHYTEVLKNAIIEENIE